MGGPPRPADEYGWWESVVIGVNGESVSLKWVGATTRATHQSRANHHARRGILKCLPRRPQSHAPTDGSPCPYCCLGGDTGCAVGGVTACSRAAPSFDWVSDSSCRVACNLPSRAAS